MAEDDQVRLRFGEQLWQALKAGIALFARYAGVDDVQSGCGGQQRRVALVILGAGASGQAVAEGKDHGIAGQRWQLWVRAAGTEQ